MDCYRCPYIVLVVPLMLQMPKGHVTCAWGAANASGACALIAPYSPDPQGACAWGAADAPGACALIAPYSPDAQGACAWGAADALGACARGAPDARHYRYM